MRGLYLALIFWNFGLVGPRYRLAGATVPLTFSPALLVTLFAAAALTLLLSVAVVATFAKIPAASVAATTRTGSSLTYLMIPVFPAGVLTWLIVATTLVLAGKQLLRRARQRVPAPGGA